MIQSANSLTKKYLKSSIIFKRGKTVTKENVNPLLGQMFLMDTDDPVYHRYLQLKRQISEEPESLPFDELLKANSGDLAASGYLPITYLRQVAAAVVYPHLIKDSCFPADVKSKAKEALQHHASVGSYTASSGVEMFRQKLAQYFSKRDDGVPCDYRNLMLNGGVIDGMRTMLKMFANFIGNKPPGIMIPTPSYPFGLLEEYGFTPIHYNLEEGMDWAPNVTKMEKEIQDARKKCVPRALVVINPGNPTGSVFKKQPMEEIIKFACKERLVILADEVYQMNIYKEHRFLSFKKVLNDMGKPYSNLELASFFSISKGVTGEPGMMAGSVELLNFSKDIKEQIRKSVSTNLCSCTVGQVMLYAFANHPVEGDPSFKLWKEETEFITKDLECKADLLVKYLNEIGLYCKPIDGAYFAYPVITPPELFVKEGLKNCYQPSTYYALKLLEETGVLVTPGDVFGKQITPHIRLSILPSEQKLNKIVEQIKCFNLNLQKKYGSC